MSPGSSTESYPAFARIGLRETPGKNLNQDDSIPLQQTLKGDKSNNKEPFLLNNLCHLTRRFEVTVENVFAICNLIIFAVTSWSKASCLRLVLRNARWFESSWGKKFSHEISASLWERCPPSIVMHLGSYDRDAWNDLPDYSRNPSKWKTREFSRLRRCGYKLRSRRNDSSFAVRVFSYSVNHSTGGLPKLLTLSTGLRGVYFSDVGDPKLKPQIPLDENIEREPYVIMSCRSQLLVQLALQQTDVSVNDYGSDDSYVPDNDAVSCSSHDTDSEIDENETAWSVLRSCAKNV
ncbi:hypothetical protein ANN_17110 [Periplaneta americana]|uniref:Uncharacterized protein n=1 Tax=Periplaneta americana TaxID=6978 RepID=A0ABQ8SS06_PERAM|nr:hypothetical protein ANN_17110 [Periplaneta americana]